MSNLPPIPAASTASLNPPTDEALKQCRNFIQAFLELADEGKAQELAAQVKQNAEWVIAQVDSARNVTVLIDIRNTLGTFQRLAETEHSPLASLVKDHTPWLLDRIKGVLS